MLPGGGGGGGGAGNVFQNHCRNVPEPCVCACVFVVYVCVDNCVGEQFINILGNSNLS